VVCRLKSHILQLHSWLRSAISFTLGGPYQSYPELTEKKNEFNLRSVAYCGVCARAGQSGKVKLIFLISGVRSEL
jgi:hypothetical protein